MLLREIKNIFHKELDDIYPKEEVDSFFYLLVEHYLGLERFVLALQPKTVVSKKEEQPLFEALTQLRLQRPIQYIMGKTSFMDIDFKVDESVLIPRPETEELVRWIIDEVRTKKSEISNTIEERSRSIKILDVGTGSGCIAISLAKNLPIAKVYALEVSEKALDLAKQNALDSRVDMEFVQANILELEKLETKFDVIVSNPPYVRELEKKGMQKNVLEHEPELALFVSDADPLIFYRRIFRFAKNNLKKEGVLYLEINQYLAKETKQLLEEHNFMDIEVRKDMYGNDRMLKGKLTNDL